MIAVNRTCLAVAALALAACSSSGSKDAPVARPSVAYESLVIGPGTQCTYGGVQINMGIDDNGNGTLDAAEVDSTEYVCNGAPGADGIRSLVSATTVAAGTPCASGGLLIEVGPDNNANGVLDSTEVSTSEYVCSGVQGAAGTTSLLRVTRVASGGGCPAGAVLVESGVDIDADNVLDSTEVTSFQYVCDGAPPAQAPVSPVALTITIDRGTFSGSLRAGDRLLSDGTRADFYSFTTAAPITVDTWLEGVVGGDAEVFVFTDACLAEPDVSLWGSCYLGAASAFPSVSAGTYVLMVRGSATNLPWLAVSYDLQLKLWNGAGMAAGVPSSTFGAGGVACVHAGTDTDSPRAIVAEGTSVVVAGDTMFGSPLAMGLAMVRFGPNGVPDGTFGANGVVVLPGVSGGSAGGNSVVIDGGKLVLGGYYEGGGVNLAAFRFNGDGSRDAAFGTNGVAVTVTGTDGGGHQALVQPDGKILVNGSVGYNGAWSFGLTRFTSSGAPDPAFDTDGYLTTTIGTDAAPYAMALQADGRILVAGYSDNHVVVVRYNSNGSLDASFDGDGIATGTTGIVTGMVIQTDGRILLAAYDLTTTPAAVKLVRYEPSGALDATYGVSGVVTIPMSTAFQMTSRIYFAPGERLIVASAETAAAGTDMVIARYALDGRLDRAFGDDGPVRVSGGSPKAVSVAPNGDVLVAAAMPNVSGIDETCALVLK